MCTMNYDNVKQNLLDKIATGNAILFTGAGFSRDSTNIKNGNPLDSVKLSEKLCDIASIPHNSDLGFVSDYCITNKLTSNVISILKELYILKKVSPDTNSVLSIPWRRFYTTNYDTGIEIGLKNNGKVTQTINIDTDIATYIKNDNSVIHINGCIDFLNEESLNTTFKLSNSSYLSTGLIDRENWLYFFRQDLEKCSAIVFLGYSLYDIEIKKILFQNENLKNKTFFITSKDIESAENIQKKFTFNKFGSILPIEKSGFSNLIKENKSLFSEKEKHLLNFAPFDENLLLDDVNKFTDKDIIDFFVTGTNQEKIVASVALNINANSHAAVIRNAEIENTISKLEENKIVIIQSSFGNGKTCLLYQIAALMFNTGKDVYFLTENENDYFEEILLFSKDTEKQKYIFIDDFTKKEDFFRAFFMVDPSNCKLICADRTENIHNAYSKLITKNADKIFFMDVDFLSTGTVKAFILNMDFLGLWGERAAYTIDKKIRYLSDKEDSVQISVALMKIMESKQIKDRIAELLKDTLFNGENKKTVFAICFLKIIGVSIGENLISYISDSNRIYSPDFFANVSIKQLFFSNNKINISYIFAKYLLNNYFTGEFISECLQKIVILLNDLYREFTQEQIFRASLRFSVLDTILPEKSKKGALSDYYEKLKRIASWIIQDPHYWMQYAMAKIMWFQYDEAQKYLDNAYSYAKSKIYTYDTKKIDNQQCRLYILLGKKETVESKAYEFYEKADKLLIYADKSHYTLHRLSELLEFCNSSFSKLSSKNQKKMKSSVKAHKIRLEKYDNQEKSDCKFMYDKVYNSICDFLQNNENTGETI